VFKFVKGHSRPLVQDNVLVLRLEQHLARTPAGLAVCIAQRLLALTLGTCSTP
jgi:hypothetical protein